VIIRSSGAGRYLVDFPAGTGSLLLGALQQALRFQVAAVEANGADGERGPLFCVVAVKVPYRWWNEARGEYEEDVLEVGVTPGGLSDLRPGRQPNLMRRLRVILDMQIERGL
jgi:hypothetical protein